ncbi:MAG: type IV pilus secretin PilQ family protein, partial [Comamonas sp.]
RSGAGDSRPFIGHVDFRRGEGGSGRVIVELPSDQISVDVRPQGQALVAEFAQTALAEGLSRRMDVTDFGTPVRFITSSEAGGRVRMVIDAQGEWTQTAHQSGRQFVIEVKPRQSDPGQQAAPGQGYSGERLTLNFQRIDVRALLQVIADFTQLNIIVSDSVAGEITLRLKDVPWDQALDIILQARNLGMRKNGTVLWIAPKDELLAKERAELEARAAMRELEPLLTRAFQLNYAKAADIAAQLTRPGSGAAGASGSAGSSGSGGTRLLSARGSVVAEPRTNQIFVSDIATKLDDIEVLLARLDKAMRQVMIEARIVVAEDTFSRDLGVRLGGLSNVGSHASIGSTYSAGSAGATGGDLVNLPATSATGSAVPSIALSLFNSGASRFLNLELQALEVDGKGKVVSSPRVMTADQVKALIEQGTEVPYQEATSSGATSVSFRKANLKLEVTPQITPEGDVILDLDINKDTLGQETTNGYAINTKHIKTQALVQNGGTIVIGGIFELEENETVSKVPLLGDIPGLGHLFKSRSRSRNKTELLVFITPRVLEDGTAVR